MLYHPMSLPQEFNMPRIHPTAVVHSSAQLADSVIVGPNALIDADVTIGEGCELMHGAHIARWSSLGENNRIFPGAVIGQEPQDLGYQGEESHTTIGNGNTFREGVTVHRGNRAGTKTVIGDNNYLMVNSHVAHNCILGNHIILVNGALLAGHVEVAERAIISGNCQIHQFVRIGAYAMMRGGSGANKDVPPFCINDGLSWLRGINAVGLRRNGFDARRIRAIREAFKAIFRSELRLEEALRKVDEQEGKTSDVQQLIDFIRSSRRGVGRGRGSGRE